VVSRTATLPSPAFGDHDRDPEQQHGSVLTSRDGSVLASVEGPWVLSLPKPLRLRLARHPAWTTWVGGLIVRAIGAWQRRVARARHLAAPQTGAITFVQRFG
jgi:hypothetical protein